jgi:hypothetical protein
MNESNPFQAEGNDDESVAFQTAISPRRVTYDTPSKMSKLESLQIREAELLKRQQRLVDARLEIGHVPNFPSFWPTVVFDLDRDIPRRAPACVTTSLYGLTALACSVCFNIVAIACVRGLPMFHHVRSLVFGIIQGFGTLYIALNYSFHRLYAACAQKDIPFSWIIVQFLLVGWCVYLSIGFPDSGCVGLATFLDLIAKSKSAFSMLVAAINTGLIVAAAFLQFVTLYKAQVYQKVSGQEDDALPNQAKV